MLWSSKSRQDRGQFPRKARILNHPKLSIDGVFSALQDYAIYSLSEDGKICDWSEGASRLTGFEAADVIGRHFSMLYRAADRNAGAARLDLEIAARSGQHQAPGWRRRKDGSEFWAANRLHALHDASGTVTGFIEVTSDLSHTKEREDQLLRAKQVAEDSTQAKSEFLASMSHELRTPLNAISGFAQLLKLGHEKLTDRQDEYVDLILESSAFLTRLISDILDLASIEARRIKTENSVVNLTEVVLSAVRLLANNARGHNIDLDTRRMPVDLFVRGDSARIMQVITNLISNSIKYSGKSGRVSVECRHIEGGKTLVKVIDTGVGIATERLGELFQPFSRLGQEGGPIQGTGIGLTTCRKLLELMHGEIGVDSVEGQGSTFWFTLRTAEQPGLQAMVQADTPEKHVVLCIEDNWANAKALRGALETTDTLVVELAETGTDGLAKAMSLRTDLVIIDLHLPDMTGFDVIKALKSNRATANIPTFALTADALPRTRERARKAGFDLFLTKPCQFAELLHAVNETLA